MPDDDEEYCEDIWKRCLNSETDVMPEGTVSKYESYEFKYMETDKTLDDLRSNGWK